MTALLVLSMAIAAFGGCSSKPGGNAQGAPGGGTDSGANSMAGALLSTPVTMHRLTRLEYSNTVRDLLGEATSLVGELPSDQSNALGYTNDGASLEMSPLLVDRYATISAQLVSSLFARLDPMGRAFANIVQWPCTKGLTQGIDVCGSVNGGYSKNSGTSTFWGIISANPFPGLQITGISVPAYGTYTFSLQAFATPALSTKVASKPPPFTQQTQPYPVVMGILIDGKEKQFVVTNVAAPTSFAFAATLDPGPHKVEVRSVRDVVDPTNQDGNYYNQSLWVSGMRIDGPQQASGAIKASDVLSCGTAAAGTDACMNNVLQSFAKRAWRRPVTLAEVVVLKQVADSISQSATEPGTADQKFQAGEQLALQAVLLSPYFIYRPELDPDASSTGSHPLDDYELASRLSYFLWSSMPDDELFARAQDGTLHDAKTLDAEVERMLDDPKASALTDGFAGQWLLTSRLPAIVPDPIQFPSYSGDVSASMVKETGLYFQEFLKQGRKLTDMFDGNFTFVNTTLATFYGMTNPSGATSTDFVQVPLDGTHRVGLLTQGSVLTVTSHPNRTSPVLRGKFVLGRLLCAQPPPPPPNVPPFNEDVTAGSVRQRMEAHAAYPCSTCHTKMDPIGFAMENFDGIGEYRTMDGKYPIDTSGLSAQGQPVSDVATLSAVIKNDPGMAPCVVRQVFSYGVGQQAVDATDGAIMTHIVSQTASGGYSLRDMIHAIVQSAAFTQRSGGAT